MDEEGGLALDGLGAEEVEGLLDGLGAAEEESAVLEFEGFEALEGVAGVETGEVDGPVDRAACHFILRGFEPEFDQAAEVPFEEGFELGDRLVGVQRRAEGIVLVEEPFLDEAVEQLELVELVEAGLGVVVRDRDLRIAPVHEEVGGLGAEVGVLGGFKLEDRAGGIAGTIGAAEAVAEHRPEA